MMYMKSDRIRGDRVHQEDMEFKNQEDKEFMNTEIQEQEAHPPYPKLKNIEYPVSSRGRPRRRNRRWKTISHYIWNTGAGAPTVLLDGARLDPTTGAMGTRRNWELRYLWIIAS